MDKGYEKYWQTKIQQAAREMQYPHTPDMTATVIGRITARETARTSRLVGRSFPKGWLAPALVLLIMMILALSLVPGVRAQIQEFLQVGPLRIFFSTATASANPAMQGPSAQPGLSGLAGQMTLAEAKNRWQFPIQLPTYPNDLGQPDLVFLQGPDDDALSLVWLDPADPQKVRLALQSIVLGKSIYSKMGSIFVEQTKVNGMEAFWITGEHILETKNGDFQLTRLVDGPVLVWTNGVITYRLESDLSMSEAVRVAESLR